MLFNNRPAKSPERDPSTLSNYDSIDVSHTDLHFLVVFEEEKVNGTVVFDLKARNDVKKVILDTSYLVIKSVEDVSGNEPSAVEFLLQERLNALGSPLVIDKALQKEQELKLKIVYETTSECTALQFLPKEATDGKKTPYVFSQCQAIHARSLFPCFDTPSVKSTYTMKVDSPYPSLVSGRFQKAENGTLYFEQPIPMASYLVALASGDITKARIGPRSDVYSEPANIDACQHEFEKDMESFIQNAEKIVFEYEWDRFDTLILPSAFPYGGMENPNITFATPTLLSGDRENVDVLAHELAHSWSGNLVTNCSWEHFWLNEGWTVYLERRILESLHGSQASHFSAIIGWNDLEVSIKNMGEDAKRYSVLVQDLKDGADPDDAFSTVPYEKGFNLLFHIEKTVGGKEIFDPFIKHYFTNYKYKSLDTYQFLDSLYEFYSDSKKAELDSIDWKTWLFSPGMPPVDPKFDTTLIDQCYSLADKWYHAVIDGNTDLEKTFSSKDIEGFSSKQSVVFLSTLISFGDKHSFSWSDHKTVLPFMAKIYSRYTDSRNAEVLFKWFLLQVGEKNTDFYDSLGEWLGTVGRMKFVRPGYRTLNEADHNKAVSYFKKFESNYHPICKALVKKDLGLA